MTQMTHPQSLQAHEVLALLSQLQQSFREGLNELSMMYGDRQQLQRATWLRDEGKHGGGWRDEGTDLGILNRGSLNISSVHYDDRPQKRLSSATALSCIVHPQHPRAPSLHTHISWTELKTQDGGGWRLMADLNPSTPNQTQRQYFIDQVSHSLSTLPEEWITYAQDQGDRYFWIPSLKRHRGVAHFYLEQWQSDDRRADLALAQRFGEQVINTYLSLLRESLHESDPPTSEEHQAQLAYHSAYFLQVLTMDRGTSSGVLVHNQNDVGILGSLPQRVDRDLLTSWISLQPSPQNLLLKDLIDALPAQQIVNLTSDIRRVLADIVRAHYRNYPDALALQARGDILPPTVANHQSEVSITNIT